MSAVVVQDILDRINRLPDEDRLVLEERLTELADAEWHKAASDARQEARARGIDQATIDRAVDELRRPA